MHRQIWLIFTILVCVIGCTSDNQTAEPEPEPTPRIVIVGTWEVSRVNDESLASYFSNEEEGLQAEITTNEWLFDSEGGFAWRLGFTLIGPLDDGVTLTLSMNGEIKGTYTVTGQRVSQEFTDVSVKLEPLALWERIGITEDDYVKELRGDGHVHSTWHLDGNTLTLTQEDGEEIVLLRWRSPKPDPKEGIVDGQNQ